MDKNATAAEGQTPQAPHFTLAHQTAHLDIDFSQQIKGRTEITIYPEIPNLKTITLNARQCQISNVLINGLAPAAISHQDPCDQLTLHFDNSNVHHHHLLTDRLESSQKAVPDPNLIVTLPRNLRIQRVDLAEIHTQNAGTIKISHPEAQGAGAEETIQGLTDTSVAKYTPLTLTIEFTSIHLREAVQFVTGEHGSGRWPHAYTRGRAGGASAAALFPCVDSLHARCTWDFTITSPRTVSDAISQSLSQHLAESLTLGDKNRERAAYENQEMVIICSGKFIEETINKTDSSKKTASFSCSQQLSAQQIGFAVGPFEKVNLNVFRDADDGGKLGENAVNMFGYCLPGRSDEVQNTCLATTKAVDTFVQRYIACPTHAFSMCFVEDMPHDVSVFAGTAMCSTRMLYPEDVIDPAQSVTRKLVHAIASQWSGINIIPETLVDTWVTIGMAHFMTDLFMRDLCGNNEYRFRIRQQADRVCELDRDRPSMYAMGNYLHVDPSIYEFLSLKSPIVLFILDRRIHKSAGASKMPGIIAKILTRARTGDLVNNAVSTELFQKTVERFYHASINDFMGQWIFGAGCPFFRAYQRFNKKKLVIEMSITQVPANTIEKELDPKFFMRDVREEWGEVFAADQQPVFTGPMTIRIHEADGTPYEHIVQIKEARTTIEVPYNTKYKRLKRSKRQRTKPNARTAATTTTAEGETEENDSLVYCLGDTLQSEEEIRDWRITEWSDAEEERMNAESYEWIRLDADFEWIARTELVMPGYMFASQVQQDRDVVAQLDATRVIAAYHPTPLVSSILVRTLMDKRYFHGVRYVAAQGLVRHATEDVNYIGLFHLKKAFEELFCTTTDQGASMTRPNDFSDQQAYIVQTGILEAISKIRTKDNHTPHEVKEFLLDKLKFNDNSNNVFSDAFYIAKLMVSLTNATVARRTLPPHSSTNTAISTDDMDIDLALASELHANTTLELAVLAEIDRYRRMDEWTSSYQNLYSRVALECQAKLMRAGVADTPTATGPSSGGGKKLFSPLHFLQYTRPGNYELLRIAAYDVLVQPGILEGDKGKGGGGGGGSVLKYILHCMVADSSSFIRRHLQNAFGVVLAKKAIGDKSSSTNTLSVSGGGGAAATNGADGTGGLTIEDASATAGGPDALAATATARDALRRTSVEAALDALKREVSANEALKTGLWRAVNYHGGGDASILELEDLRVMLDFVRMCYEPREELKLALRLPRYWRVRYEGKGKLHFTLTDKIRTKKMEKWVPAAPPPKPTAASTSSQPQAPPLQSRPSMSGTGLKLKFKPAPAPVPTASVGASSAQEAPPKKKQKTVSKSPTPAMTPDPVAKTQKQQQQHQQVGSSVGVQQGPERPLGAGRVVLKFRQGSVAKQ